MPLIQLETEFSGVSRATVWEVLTDVGRYPSLVGDVIETQLRGSSPGERTVGWKVLLNGSPVEWVERELLTAPSRMAFQQTEGDFDLFEGSWDLGPAERGVRVCWTARYELGIGSLAPLLEPTWTQSLRHFGRTLLQALAEEAASS